MNGENVSLAKNIAIGCLLVIICICSFLFAKYIIRGSAGWEKPPVDVSEKV